MNLNTTQWLAESLIKEHGLDGWTFKFDNARKRGGVCVYNTRTISMSRYLVPMWEEEQVRNTLLHEIAHALAGHAAGHGPQWARIAREIGCNAKRTHSNATVPGKWIPWCEEHGALSHRPRHRRNSNLVCARCRTAVVWKTLVLTD
jgi:SprT protein